MGIKSLMEKITNPFKGLFGGGSSGGSANPSSGSSTGISTLTRAEVAAKMARTFGNHALHALHHVVRHQTISVASMASNPASIAVTPPARA